jgi:energy-coupling factor transport system permease protein
VTAPPTLHAVTWLVWAVAAALAVELAPNPLYVVLVVAVCTLVVEVHGGGRPLARAFPVLVALGAVFGLLRVLLTVLTTHGGPDVLVTLPSTTLPTALGGFTVGGTVELPVLFQAGAESLAIVGVLAAFGAFNAVAAHDELVRSAPRAFHEAGLVVTVALTVLPATLTAVQAVREADRARTGGTVVRRGRLLRLVVPVLETGLERAVGLAESMDARGFARLPAGPSERVAGWLGLGSLLALGGAFVALVGRAGEVAVVLGAAGALAVVGAVAAASRASGRSRHRPRRPTRRDWTVGAVALVSPAVLAVLALAGNDTLAWSATPVALPRFDPLAAAAVAVLAAPAFLAPAAAPAPTVDPLVLTGAGR